MIDKEIETITNYIEAHRKSAKWLSILMWIVALSTLVVDIMIWGFAQTMIANMTQLVNAAAMAGWKGGATTTANIASGITQSTSNYVVLGVFVTILLVTVGVLRFHLKEIALGESRLYAFHRIRASMDEELSDEAKHSLINGAFTPETYTAPFLHMGSETIGKIADAVFSKLEKVIPSRRTEQARRAD